MTRVGRRIAARGAREGGYAMVVVLVFVSLSTLALAAGYDRMHQVFVFEEASNRLPSTSDGAAEALGAGLARLQTGQPVVDAANEFRCDLRLRDSNGDPVTFTLTYTRLAGNEWSLEAGPSASTGPACPPSFTADACPAPL